MTRVWIAMVASKGSWKVLKESGADDFVRVGVGVGGPFAVPRLEANS
jgi:hypothetical protein